MLTQLAFLQHRIGFFGHEGGLWAFIGFLFTVVVIAILFKIMKLLLPALGVTEPWVSVIYWVAVLLCVFVFANYAFGGWF
jgi:predicted Zn-ribbon and HTH transcriptional regulator